MNKILLSLLLVTTVVACTHASVSSIPMEIPGVGKVYRYQGRANFSHQLAEADRVMIEQCKIVNGGTPVIVDQQLRALGFVGIDNSVTSTNLSATQSNSGMSSSMSGNANTTAFGSGSSLQNMNQEVFFKCVIED